MSPVTRRRRTSTSSTCPPSSSWCRARSTLAGRAGAGRGHPERVRRALQRHGRRVQRQPGCGRPRRPGLTGACRARLQGRPGRELLRPVAGRPAGDAGLLRRRGVGGSAADRAPVRHFGYSAEHAAARARRGSHRLDRHPGSRRDRPAVEHASGGAPSAGASAGTQSVGAQGVGAGAAASPTATPTRPPLRVRTAAGRAARSRCRRTRLTASLACTDQGESLT